MTTVPTIRDMADVIRVRRPSGLTDAQWAEVRRATAEHIDQLVATASGRRCLRHDWCTGAHRGHDDGYHAGGPVELVGYDDVALTDWWAWPVCDDATMSEPVIQFEGQDENKADAEADCAVPARHVGYILTATATPEARAALVELVAQVTSEVDRSVSA